MPKKVPPTKRSPKKLANWYSSLPVIYQLSEVPNLKFSSVNNLYYVGVENKEELVSYMQDRVLWRVTYRIQLRYMPLLLGLRMMTTMIVMTMMMMMIIMTMKCNKRQRFCAFTLQELMGNGGRGG